MDSAQKCVICGEELDISTTQLVFVTKEGGIECACCNHEGSQALKEYAKSRGGTITFDEYYKTLKSEGK